MLYYTILYLLYYTILYYTILYYTIIYYTILYYTILCYIILYYIVLYYTITQGLKALCNQRIWISCCWFCIYFKRLLFRNTFRWLLLQRKKDIFNNHNVYDNKRCLHGSKKSIYNRQKRGIRWIGQVLCYYFSYFYLPKLRWSGMK